MSPAERPEETVVEETVEETVEEVVEEVEDPDAPAAADDDDDFDDLSDEEEDINIVQIDALALVKVVQHCHECLPQSGTGLLLGLDFDSTLEVTNTLPGLPAQQQPTGGPDAAAAAAAAEAESANAEMEYVMGMLEHLNMTNVDSNVVGWYQSVQLGSFVSKATVDMQFRYQEDMAKAVLIVYDPVRTPQGGLSLHAYRLSTPFMSAMRTAKKNSAPLQGNLTYNDVFVEVPLKVHNSLLANALLYELEGTPVADTHAGDFVISANPLMEKNIEQAIESIDALSSEQIKYHGYQRSLHKYEQSVSDLMQRKARNAHRVQMGQEPLEDEDMSKLKSVPVPPNRIESLVVASQLAEHCDQIQHFAGGSMSKLFLTKAFEPDA